ncbi:DUF1146 family protein [Virgibacillus sp. W0181]|uniref:DUF1146 family protein n=1 Tax=Virgibacillus sp. W0181 TaxID=3391581 RepID=UPI003F48D509
MFSIGQMALVTMISHLIFIYITWVAIQSLNVDPLIRKGKIVEARILIIFVTIFIGTNVSRFVLDILNASQNLIYLF